MGFSKQEHLQLNVEALELAFVLERQQRRATADERQVLKRYSGFGGLKFILNLDGNPTDIQSWSVSEQHLFSGTRGLHELLRLNAKDEKEYRRYQDSMRSSVLTAFYTPPEIISTIKEVLDQNGIVVQKLLEPSAGIGAFIEPFVKSNDLQVTAYEKDLLTGMVLKHLYPEANTHIKGFEEIHDDEKGSYDLVTSNIPFGDTSVFDLSYSRSKDPAKVQAARSVHNYFFLKGTDMLRNGGVLVYITSQGVLNSPSNIAIREALVREHKLVSAIRLPNNLFTDYAGTEVGSDLIILQKRIGKKYLSRREMIFCDTRTTPDGMSNNALLENPALVVHTSSYQGTNPYGKPTIIYEHQGGVEGIAKDLKRMLAGDFSVHLDVKLYKGERNNEPVIQIPIDPKPSPPKPEPEIFSGSTDAVPVKRERVTINQPDQKTGTVSNLVYLIFSRMDRRPPLSQSPPVLKNHVKKRSMTRGLYLLI